MVFLLKVNYIDSFLLCVAALVQLLSTMPRELNAFTDLHFVYAKKKTTSMLLTID